MSTNKSKTPLDYVAPFRPKLSSSSIEISEAKLEEPVAGISVIDASVLGINPNFTEEQITTEEIQMSNTQNSQNVQDITDFGCFVPTSDVIDATDFPIITDKTEILIDNVSETKLSKETKEKTAKA